MSERENVTKTPLHSGVTAAADITIDSKVECPICLKQVLGLTAIYGPGDDVWPFRGCQACLDFEFEKNPLAKTLFEIVKARDKHVADLGEKLEEVFALIVGLGIDDIRKVLQVAIELPDPWSQRAADAHGRLRRLQDEVKEMRDG